ncbi:peptidase S49 [Methylobacterium sp. 4-46]|uniref:S49 family peptidase n=1 Tax=unclassified Methylobacterium TaxID=2615210 RepID=UPI000152DF4A|nr:MULTISPECIES: S49 family peptidase [Methylobacterium]ACA18500.1 peptidase S49 [Methylobacterium sp. 4-46]WFT77788.1 S49 family peptidase [Methylobacterium nodulans]
MHYHRIAGRFYNRPLLVAPATAETISAFLLSRMSAGPAAGGNVGGIEHDAGESLQIFRGHERADGSVEVHTPRASRFYGDYPLAEDGSKRPLPFRRTAEGVAILTLVGEWVNRGGWVGASSGLISYEGFAYQMRMAAADPRTKAILLDLESPGGEAVGAFEAAELVRQVASQKSVTALVNGMASSAAYAIASGASRIVSIPTGLAGSIGVVLMHLDISEYLRAEGMKPTLIFAGDHKVDWNPFEPLPDAVRADLQKEVEGFYAKFVTTVAAGRPGLSEQAIRDTEARTFMGEEAIKAGLVDAIGTFDAVLADLSAAPAAGRSFPSRPTGASMSDNTPTPGASAGFTQSDLDTARAESFAAGKAEGLTEGTKAGASTERERIGAILGSDEAKGREASARHLALSTDLSLDAAKGVLSGLQAAAPAGPSLDARMAGRADLNLDPDTPPAAQTDPKADAAASWDEIVAGMNARLPAAARIPGVR